LNHYITAEEITVYIMKTMLSPKVL